MSLDLFELADEPTPMADVIELREDLAAEQNMNDLLLESLADLELAAEDRGWQRLGLAMEHDFSRSGLTSIVRNCRVMAIASPLVKRGLQLRHSYVWGQGVQIAARADGTGADGEQDVNAVVQAFLDDPANAAELTSSQAAEENEKALGTDGNLCFAFFTEPVTGAVQVRAVPLEEIVDVVHNPEDRSDPWFYLRAYEATTVKPFLSAAGQLTTRSRATTVRVIHPALGYRPRLRPTSIDGYPVLWDQPVLHMVVNRPKHAKWGIPDAYAQLPWARAYEGFLTDWARLVKALSKFAWRLTGDKSAKARKAADKLREVRAGLPIPPLAGSAAGDVGSVAAGGPGVTLEAIPKSGATIDSGSGKPLAGMVAAGFGVSVVDLLADPGTTGARAVAETLDKPVTLEMNGRRKLWASTITTMLNYVIDQSVKAPRGALTGTVTLDRATGREVVTLAGDTDRTIEIDWPPLDELDPTELIKAIVDADTTRKVPPLVIAKALLRALGEKDIDEILDEMTDEQGNWLDPYANAAEVATAAFEDGREPGQGVT